MTQRTLRTLSTLSTSKYKISIPRLILLLILWIVLVLSSTAALVRWFLPDDRPSVPIRTRPPEGGIDL